MRRTVHLLLISLAFAGISTVKAQSLNQEETTTVSRALAQCVSSAGFIAVQREESGDSTGAAKMDEQGIYFANVLLALLGNAPSDTLLGAVVTTDIEFVKANGASAFLSESEQRLRGCAELAKTYEAAFRKLLAGGERQGTAR